MSDEQLIKTPGVFGENGNFLLERELGAGGMGGVYMGRDKMLDRPVAVKVMLKEYGNDPSFVEKFKKEAQAAARLIHPNIAQIYSYGISDGMPYIAMELVAGGSLDGLMKVQGKTIDVPRVMKICEQVAQALRCAADQGLVHGDVKPENVLLDANGNAKLVDFGLAAMQNDTDEIWGTPYYIAPEKVKKEPVDYRADMYSLGGTIYHALTGSAPFEGDDATAVVRKRFEGAPRKPSEVRPGLSPQVDFLVMKMLALNPADRYPTFEALLEDFKKVMTTGLSTTQTVADLEPKGAAKESSGSSTGSGGKKLMIKPKKKFAVKKSTDEEPPAEEGDGEATEGEEASGAKDKKPRKRFKTNLKKKKLSNGDGADAEGEDEGSSETTYDDEEEEGGNLGLKVLLVIGGVILLIGLVVGGLFGLQHMNASGNAKEIQARVQKGYSDVSKNFDTLAKEVANYRERINTTVSNAVYACEGKTKQIAAMMNEVYPEAYAAGLKPEKTKVLLDAEASLLEPEEPEVKPEAAAAEGEAKPAEGEAAAGAEAKPAEGEAKPAEGAAKPAEGAPAAGGEAKPAEGAAAPAPAPEAAPAPAAEQPAAEPAAEGEAAESARPKPTYADKVGELWVSVYEAQAALIAVNKELDSITRRLEAHRGELDDADKTEAKLRQLNDRQTSLRDHFKAVQGDKPAETASKIGDIVKSRGNRWVRECTENVRKIKQEENMKRAEAAEKERREKAAEEAKRAKEELVAKEVESAKELYQSLCANAASLNWKDSLKQLNDMKADFKSGEGRLEVDRAIKNFQRMADVQAILQRNIKGYTFRRKLPKDAKAASITGFTVTDVTDDKIALTPKKGRPKDLSWRRLYRDYHENFGELINTYIRKGDVNCKPKLGRRERANAMLGVGLTLHLICSDDASSAEYAEAIVKQAVKDFPAIREDAKAIFPDIDFSTIDAEAKAADL